MNLSGEIVLFGWSINQKSSSPPSDNPSERYFCGRASHLFYTAVASPVVIFICCLTKLYLDCISTHHPKVKLLDGKLQTSQTGCKSLLLSNRWQQLNCEQALQSYCPVFSGSIRYTLSGHPMFGEPTIISCFFQNMSLYNSNIKVVGGKACQFHD